MHTETLTAQEGGRKLEPATGAGGVLQLPPRRHLCVFGGGVMIHRLLMNVSLIVASCLRLSNV